MKNQQTIKNIRRLLFLPLLSFFFVLHGYVDFFHVLFVKNAVLLLLEYWAFSALLFLVFYSVLRSWSKAALVVAFLLCFHFFFGALHDGMKRFLGEGLLTRYSFLVPFVLLLLIFILYRMRKTASSFRQLTRYLNLLLLVLVLMDLTRLTYKALSGNGTGRAISKSHLPACPTCATPDIYLIVADGYSGSETLKNVLHFDNTSFELELSSRKFHLVPYSTSNYNSTPYSIASILNMEYLSGVVHDHQRRDDILRCFEKVNNSRLLTFLRERGYAVINHSIFNLANQETKATGFTLFPTKEKLISNQTFLSRLQRDIGHTLYPKIGLQSMLHQQWYSVLEDNTRFFALTVQESGTTRQQPKFVYTHLELPHYPYYFKKNGSPMPLYKVQDVKNCDEGDYLEYLQYANKKLLSLLDQLQQNTGSNAVILLMSDHGLREFTKPTEVRHSFPNLNAVYLPNQQYAGFKDSLSNVNQFRVLLNTLFSQQLPLLKDTMITVK